MNELVNKFINIMKINKMDSSILYNKMTESIGDNDIDDYSGHDDRNKIITYNDLSKFNNIEQILPHNKSWIILLIETEQNSGHWTLLMRYNNTIEFFDSYALGVSEQLKFNSNSKNIMLGQGQKYLNQLLNKSLNKYNIIYNKIKYQSMNPIISTCGRHCLVRLIMMINYNLDLNKYNIFMNKLKKISKYDFDEIVSIIINV